MSNCGASIPLDDLVEAIIDNYGDAFAAEVIKRIDLSRYVTVAKGEANDITLRDSLTVDEAVKGDLCSILQDCISSKLQEELGCERDNHVVKFYIDKEKDHLAIELKFGESYYISRAELESWLDFKSSGGGIESGVLTVTVEQDHTSEPNVLPRITKIIEVTNKDGSKVDIDISKLPDIAVVGGEIIPGNVLRLSRSDGEDIDVTLPITSGDGAYIVSGVFVEDEDEYKLDFTKSDDTHVVVDMTEVVNKIITTVFDMVMKVGYTINTKAEDYLIGKTDFNGRTIIRADKDGDQVITVPKPSDEDFIGKSIIIRKTNGEVGSFVTLKASEGVTLVPEDASPIRRVGSSVTLVYVGDGVYDVFGELP